MPDQYDPKRKGREHIWPAQEVKNMSKEESFKRWLISEGGRTLTIEDAYYAGWLGHIANGSEPRLVTNKPAEYEGEVFDGPGGKKYKQDMTVSPDYERPPHRTRH